MLCDIYRSEKRTETYLYLPKDAKLEDLPEALRQGFGQATWVMELELTTDRKLARADVGSVMESLANQGFYLQLPPKEHELRL